MGWGYPYRRHSDWCADFLNLAGCSDVWFISLSALGHRRGLSPACWAGLGRAEFGAGDEAG